MIARIGVGATKRTSEKLTSHLGSGRSLSNTKKTQVTMFKHLKDIIHPKRVSTTLKFALNAHRAKASRPRKRSPIFNLPKDILVKIYYLLDPVDQACLALTCTDYLYLFWKVEGITIWGLPTGAHAIGPAVTVHSRYTTREKLSCRLQNRDWIFCGKCRRLHPRKAYEAQERARQGESRRQRTGL